MFEKFTTEARAIVIRAAEEVCVARGGDLALAGFPGGPVVSRPTAPQPARAGMHTGLVVYAALKAVPRAASASRFGVWMTGCPA